MNRTIDAMLRPQLLAAYAQPESLRRLAAAVGAPLAYATVRHACEDGIMLATLQNAARLQILRSAQTRRQAAAILAGITDQGYVSCAVGGLASAWTCHVNPSYRLLPQVDLLVAPEQFDAIADWLRGEGFGATRPLSHAVLRKLWAQMEPSGFAPLRPAQGNLRVRLLDHLTELQTSAAEMLAQAETVNTHEGPMRVLSAPHHSRYLAGRVSASGAVAAQQLRAAFDILARAAGNSDAALSDGMLLESAQQEFSRAFVDGVIGEPEENERETRWFDRMARRLGIKRCPGRVPLQLERAASV